jgi:CheY-like chemotaxis protein
MQAGGFRGPPDSSTNILEFQQVTANKNMRILIVDDFSTMRRIIKNLLGELGYTNTAEAKREQIIEAAQAGVNGYVIKPFTAQTLEEKLGQIFERLGAAA